MWAEATACAHSADTIQLKGTDALIELFVAKMFLTVLVNVAQFFLMI